MNQTAPTSPEQHSKTTCKGCKTCRSFMIAFWTCVLIGGLGLLACVFVSQGPWAWGPLVVGGVLAQFVKLGHIWHGEWSHCDFRDSTPPNV